jgi:hypothetical protein
LDATRNFDSYGLCAEIVAFEASMRAAWIMLAISFSVGASAQIQTKKAEGSGRYPDIVQRTAVALEAEGLIRPEQVDPSRTEITQVSSQKLSKTHSRQMYFVEFLLRNGGRIEAIARHDESPIPEESGFVVYVVSKILQPDGKPVPPSQ